MPAITSLTTQNFSDVFGSAVSITSPSFTPVAGSLLFVIVAGRLEGSLLNLSSAGGWSISNSGNPLQWTKHITRSDDGVVQTIGIGSVVFVAQVASPGSMTVTVAHTDTGTNPGATMHVFSVTGHQKEDPFKGSPAVSITIGAAAFSMSLITPPDRYDLVIAYRAFEDAGAETVIATPGTTFTELYDTAASTSGEVGLQTQYRVGGGNIVDWADVAAGTSAALDAGLAVAFIVRAETFPNYINHPEAKIRQRAQGLI